MKIFSHITSLEPVAEEAKFTLINSKAEQKRQEFLKTILNFKRNIEKIGELTQDLQNQLKALTLLMDVLNAKKSLADMKHALNGGSFTTELDNLISKASSFCEAQNEFKYSHEAQHNTNVPF